MAKIILEPNEVFEHFHSEESTTTLLSGRAHYRMENFEQDLELNVPILTPATKSHSITNTGLVECMFGCGHG
jgi:mannose-6-phosphate isomerase-like protein (cupin superfamily)